MEMRLLTLGKLTLVIIVAHKFLVKRMLANHVAVVSKTVSYRVLGSRAFISAFFLGIIKFNFTRFFVIKRIVNLIAESVALVIERWLLFLFNDVSY